MSRQLPERPNLGQLKKQAKDLLREVRANSPEALKRLGIADPKTFALHSAQLVIAKEYGFKSWEELRRKVDHDRAMIKPPELETEPGRKIWETITAAASGDVCGLRRLFADAPELSRTGYFYTPPIHFAVREGHLEAVRVLLDAGADPEWNGYYGMDLAGMARERGHEAIARLLETARKERGRIAPSEAHSHHPIHTAAQKGDLRRVRQLLDAEPALLNQGDQTGATPLHKAVMGSARNVIELLLDRGANIHAIHSVSAGAGSGWWAQDVQAVDIAIWGTNSYAPPRADLTTARLLLERGAACDLTIAAALGDIGQVQRILDTDPASVRQIRANGKRPLTAAVEFGHDEIARLLLVRGAMPSAPELGAERGGSLHAAARRGDRAMVELLLTHGADPNGDVDTGGSAVFAAKTPELRALLLAKGGKQSLDPYDLVWLDQDDEVMRLVREDPKSAERGCGGVFTAVCTRGKRDLLKRLLAVGIRVPSVVTGCQSYLLEQPDMLKTLLDSGMNPDLANWQRVTLLHCLCGSGTRHALECAALLLDAGATITARDNEYKSTPLAWAARNNALDMARFLLSRGAPTALPDDEPWATPLAWAERRRHAEITELLRKHGAAT
jgi:ankyrin repeat protein